MTTLMQAHRQWSSRAPDERFTSLIDMQSFKRRVGEQSHSTVISSRKLAIEPTPDDVCGLMVVGDDEHDTAALTHWSFGQLCSLASPGNSPASYLRDANMPAPIVADCLNYNLRFTRGVEDVGILLTEDGHVSELREVNGPNYGRVWDADIVDLLYRLPVISICGRVIRQAYHVWGMGDAGILFSQRTGGGRAAVLGTTRERAGLPAGSDDRQHARGDGA